MTQVPHMQSLGNSYGYRQWSIM